MFIQKNNVYSRSKKKNGKMDIKTHCAHLAADQTQVKRKLINSKVCKK